MSRAPFPVPAAPPKEEPQEEPSALWLALTALPRPFKVVPFPRALPDGSPVGELAIWPLTQEEQMAANAEADRFTKKLLQDPQQKDQANLGYHHTYSNETAIQILFRACRQAEDVSRPLFPSPSQMRKHLSTDEVGVLFNNYLTIQSEVGPIVAHMTSEEMEGMILRLAAQGTAFPFDSLSWEQQRALVSSMAFQLVSCWTDMFSAGLPLDVSTYARDRVAEIVAETKNAPDPESATAAADAEPSASE